jgi:lipopolysaccharide export LptBFGC system permease protein LptF
MSEHKIINTFTQIPVATQILSYIIVVMELVLYFACVFPRLESLGACITLTVVLCALTVTVITFTLVASLTDPTDPVIA